MILLQIGMSHVQPSKVPNLAFVHLSKLWFALSDRPESSLTVASECSSTISSEEEAAKKAEEAVKEVEPRPASPNSSISEDEDSGEGGDTWATPTNQSTPSKDSETNEKNTLATSAGNSTKNRLANLFNHMKIPKFKMKNHNSEPPSLETTPKKAATPRFNRSNSMSSEASGATNQAFTRNTKVSLPFQN